MPCPTPTGASASASNGWPSSWPPRCWAASSTFRSPGSGPRSARSAPPVTVFGVTYRVPLIVQTGRTTIAVNVGGAIVPSAVAIYLICHDRLHLSVLIATLAVIAIVFAVARPVPGVGIVTPALVPAVSAALVAVCLGGHFVAAMAYVAGTFGTLVGADVLNLPRLRSLRAPVVSIGGAGTFDGVFLAGLVAVLLASL